jgi:NADH-quinone oxidoreductase subunit H
MSELFGHEPFWVVALKAVLVFVFLVVYTLFNIWFERRVVARMQHRIGPNVHGPFGLLQSLADGVKLALKEDVVVKAADKVVYVAAPIIATIPAFLAWAVIPFGPEVRIPFTDTVTPLQLTDLPVAVLYILAVTSIGVYGIVLAGWSSGSTYALLGGMRSSAQMISYEVAMGMSLVPVLLLSGNVTFAEIIRTQQAGLWFVLPLFLSFFIFLVAGFAETNRLPFDLPEAESELIAGYHTEYSAMKFSMFPIAEYSNMATVSAMLVTLFFGGWDIPGITWDEQGGLLQTLATGGFMFVKVFCFLFLFMWVRWTLPRFRYDQLMALGWKVMLPLALVYIMVTTVAIWGIDQAAASAGPRLKMLILFGLNLVIGYLVFFVLDRGWILSGSYRAGTPARAGAPRAGIAS